MKRRSAKASASPLPLSHEGSLTPSRSPSKQRHARFSTKMPIVLLGLALLYSSMALWRHCLRRWSSFPYYPQIRHDITLKDWSGPPLIHIVKTRFMQEQGNLTALGHARLALFRVFCLPTMIGQTSSQFLWIIKTDPQLDDALLQGLREALAPYPHFYLVASNSNFRINRQFPGAWRGRAEVADLSQSLVYTGDRTRLEAAMALSEDLIVLETRLDADDGLHRHFVEQLQATAVQTLTDPQIKWMYWCARRVMEWYWMDPLSERYQTSNVYRYGALSGVSHENLCVTPGITTGFPPSTEESSVPIYAHDKLVLEMRDLPPDQACGLASSKDCLQFLQSVPFCAIRSRSPTSAGMLNVQLADNDLDKIPPYSWYYYTFWNVMHEHFGLRRSSLAWVNGYLTDHLVEVAQDNLLGQCTSGHSCKVGGRSCGGARLDGLVAKKKRRIHRLTIVFYTQEKAKKSLQDIIDSRHNASLAMAARREQQ